MKMQRYLKFDDDRPRWAVMADSVINMKIASTRGIEENTLTNLLLQNVAVDTRATEGGLPTSIQKMLQVAKKYSVTFHPIILENELKRQMPAWFHIGLAQEKYLRISTASMICMRKSHEVQTVGDMMNLGRTLGSMHHHPTRTGKTARAPHIKT